MTIWRLIDSGPCDAAYNMALDEAIAISVRNGDAPQTLRLYGWEVPSVSLGSFQKITDIDCNYCERNNIPVVRRPTGGRGILHGDELTYSFSAKNEGHFSNGLLKTYRKLSVAFYDALQNMGLPVTIKMEREAGRNLTRSPLCFKSTSYGELSFNGKKIIGSAQKRWPDGFLQQGSIPYSIDYGKISMVFKNESKGISGLKELLPDFDREMFKKRVKSAFEELFDITLAVSYPSPREEELARFLSSEKHLKQDWIEGLSKHASFYNKNEIPKRA
ncbi:MAG: lipoate--protein ligase family protein [Nitrospirae bacterium]|nr:lipoate--protein ligase family protein [Nitrospirota bacterium]MCL5978882.1 lipoate--protein ligase family protein [Nitrospirota bacterium]